MAARGIFVYVELKQRYKRLSLIDEKINILPTHAVFLATIQTTDISIVNYL